jgi:phage-related minor tail protein
MLLTVLSATTTGLGTALLAYRVTRRARQARTFIRQAHQDRLDARAHREVTEKLYTQYGDQLKGYLDKAAADSKATEVASA